MKPNLLLIDDESAFVHKMQLGFKEYLFTPAKTFDQAASLLKNNQTDLILLDLNLDPTDEVLEGLEYIQPLKEQYPDIPLIVVTADEKTETVVAAMKLGADDFLRKSSFDLLSWKKKFDLLIENTRLLQENKELKDQETQKFPFIGHSAAIQEVRKTLDILAESPGVTVLITGETGVGKEVAARYLHQKSPRKNKPFVAVNPSAIPESLLESTLFGHKKGAFTGATYKREGYFRKANGGILFLDEIGDINANLQIKLLRFLENKTIQVVGDEKDIQLDVQIVAATNRNLHELVEEEIFRADLYYRIKNFQVEIPPLRYRRDDIEPVLGYYLREAGYEKIEHIIEDEVIERLKFYQWPGNIRELKNAIDAMLLKAKVKHKSRVDLSCLPEEIREPKGTPQPLPGEENINIHKDFKTQIAHSELSAIEEALKKTYGQKQAAAELLNMSADQMRYRVLKYWKIFPNILKTFSTIIKYYKLSE